MSQLISGTMLRDLLLCERRFGLDLFGELGDRDETSPFVRMLWRDGLAHEDEILSGIAEAATDLRGLDRVDREARTSLAVDHRAPTILGAVLSHDDLIGMPDVMRLTPTGYVALDVKAGSALEGPRGAYKASYLIQVSHYAHLIATTGIGTGDVAGIIDARGDETMYDLHLRFGRDRRSGSERHLDLLAMARDIIVGGRHTRGALSSQCGMCDWRSTCRRELATSDDLTQLAGLGRAIRTTIEPLAPTIADLAKLAPGAIGDGPLPGLGRERLARFAARARLWKEPASQPVAHRPLRLPNNPHSIDFDVEADPMRGIVYLHGFWHERPGCEDEFVHFFAPTIDEEGERQAFALAINHFRRHRSAHWFHYSAYERTAYAGLQRRHPQVCDADEIDEIFAPERCTDLYRIVASDTDWPLSSYGIKSIAKSVGFSWSDLDPSGSNSIEWFDTFARTGDTVLRDRIIRYNADDVLASKHVRRALAELDGTGRIAGFRRPAP
ncbi:TM0106 family RecB-like putative nuclease [Sphingomonas sp. 2SG]|uniref:TM0106 family RecB-like putative nuclease n=1 Tax=Sphingomonas sp. 2SG TaxID=2502201 RepID=UPI001485006D|nr:TM0106 family RecB-like putative nuclease [Sphingomonas sp. 2SG]